MMKILILLILCFCSVSNADIIISNQPKTNFILPKEEFIIPWQADGNTEINQNIDSPLHAYLPLTHTYKKINLIFILPHEYYGTSELYTLGFYKDVDFEIENEFEANWYRKRFKVHYFEEEILIEREKNIPEPSTLILFSVYCFPLFFNKGKQ